MLPSNFDAQRWQRNRIAADEVQRRIREKQPQLQDNGSQAKHDERCAIALDVHNSFVA